MSAKMIRRVFSAAQRKKISLGRAGNRCAQLGGCRGVLLRRILSLPLRARNRLLSESWERVEGTERALQNEGDPGRRRELTARLDQEIRTLQRQIHLGRRADSIRDRQIAEWRGRFNTELAGIEEESARRAFLNWCLRVLIHAHEDQPPQN
ncbi:unnamed protein product [Arabidopsis thaliana]|uniref:Uncharacterized protein n=1 Tax=Arabidopsis thaliana TaxID=3702 RepID=A0A5S9YID4_ARATH|nr:unnamed protein product [Arabidopsis thaliana]